MNEEYKRLIKKGTFASRMQAKVFYFLLLLISASFLFAIITQNTIELASNLLMFFILGAVLFAFYWKNRHNFKPLNFWLDIVGNKGYKLVWIKPIKVNHQAYFVITYAETSKFEVFLDDGTHTVLDFPEEMMTDFYEMMKTYAPHVHIGYSDQIRKIYKQNPKKFIDHLKEHGIYQPIGGM